MGWDGAGGYVRQHNFSADASAGINILAARMDAEIDDVASAMTLAWARNGQNVPTQDMPMGGRKFVNVGAPTSVSNFIRAREFIENVPIFMQDVESSSDRISVSSQYFTSVSSNQAPGDGTKIMVRVNSNKSSAVLYLDGHSANVEYQDGNRIAGAMVSGGIYELTYSSADTAWKLPAPGRGRTPAEISASVTPVNYQYEELDPHRYSNTLDHAAVQLAVNVAAQKTGGGRVPIRENFAFTSPVDMALNVIIDGQGGRIACNACGAFVFDFVTGVGQHGIVGNLHIDGTNCETEIAIDQPGTGSDADTCYGIVLNGVQIRNFNKCIRFRTAWWSSIHNVWGEHINSGVDLAGYNIGCSLLNTRFVKGNGCGTGASYGYLMSYATFTNGGSHVRSPEGIYGSGFVEAFNFEQAMHLDAVTGLDLTGVDLLGSVNAIKFSTLAGIVNVSGYFAVSGAASVACIEGAAQAVVGDSAHTSFSGSCVGSGTVTCAGFRGRENHANVDMKLEFSGFSTHDIQLESCGNINILTGTKCRSAVTTSIRITATLAARPITIADGVYCAGRVDVPFADTHSAQVFVGALTGAYSTVVRGVSTITNPATSVTTTFDSLRGSNNIPDIAAMADTGMALDLFLGAPSADVDGVWGSAAVDGVTINVNTTPASSVTIPWEVRVRQRHS
jgi:hypothetical protein